MGLLILVLEACKGSPSNASPPAVSPPPSEPSAPTSPAPADLASPTETAQAQIWSFDGEQVDTHPSEFSFGRTGSGEPGRWVVKAVAEAPSGANALAQLDADNTNFRFPVAVANTPVLSDVRVSVRCKMVSGRVDQACGLVARYRDENNYFVTRANALESNIRLYTVKDGKRKEIASHDGPVSANAWHEYRLDVRGDLLEVFWDGQRVLEHRDSTITDAGRAGVWTKADSITYFDDLKVEPLQ
jgi:hypothetical protein